MVKIRSWFIDGFGQFNSFGKELPESSFILIYGSNETGKSTLFSFLRGMLSNFPGNRQSKEKKYEPLKGGNHGGYIVLSHEAEEETKIRVSRSLKEKSHEYDLIQGDRDVFKNFTNFLDPLEREHFKSICAFDLQELTELSLLDNEALNEVLFSSVVSGGESVVSSTSAQLRERCKELLKPKSKGILQEIEEKLDAVGNKKSELLQEVKKAEELSRGFLQTQDEITAIEEKIKNVEFLIKKKEQEGRLQKAKEQLDLIQDDIEEFSSQRIPTEEQIDRFYSLKIKSELLSEGQVDLKPELSALVESESALFEKKDSMLSLYAHFEEMINKSAELVLLDENAELVLKKNKFFLYFANISIIIGGVLLYFDEMLYSTCFVFIMFVSLCISIRYRKIFSSIQDTIDKQITEREKTEEDLRIKTKSLGIEDITDEAIEVSILRVDRELQNISFRKENIKDKKENDENQLKLLTNEIKDFLQSFSCATQEAFESRIKSSEKLKVLRVREEEVNQIFEREKLAYEVFDDGETPIVEDENSYKDVLELKDEKDILLEKHKASITKNSELSLRLTSLANSDELQSCSLEEASLKQQYEALLTEWRETVLAAELLEESLKKLVQGKYKKVLDNAGILLSKITSNTYLQIIVATEKSELLVKNSNGALLPVKELSRGTIEQIYLAVRLSLAQHFGHTFYQLPVLLDDILVNSDLDRSKKMFEVLSEFSNENQIFFFTCHQWVRDLVEEIIPGRYEVVL